MPLSVQAAAAAAAFYSPKLASLAGRESIGNDVSVTGPVAACPVPSAELDWMSPLAAGKLGVRGLVDLALSCLWARSLCSRTLSILAHTATCCFRWASGTVLSQTLGHASNVAAAAKAYAYCY